MPQGATGVRAGVIAPIEHELAVNDHVFDPTVVLEGLFVGGMVYDAFGIENGEVREISGCK